MLVFIIYLLTLAPSVNFIDSGELAAVAHTLGIPHPTGYPLFTLLAAGWARLPLGGPIYRLNLLAAVLVSLAVGLFVPIIWHLLGLTESVRRRVADRQRMSARDKKLAKKQRPANPAPGAVTVPPLTDGLRLGATVFGALVIGLSETVWSTALSLEVYSLHLLLVALTLVFFLRAMVPAGSVSPGPGAKPDGGKPDFGRGAWLMFCLALGLSFSNHLTTILLGPALLAIFFWRQGFSPAAWRRIARGIPLFLLGLLPYAYLPLRAAAHPGLNWGDPSTLERLVWHVSGKQYRSWMFSDPEVARRQFEYFCRTFPAEFGYVILPLILAGAVAAWRRHRQTGVLLGLLFTGCLLYSINYDINDIDSYFLLAYVVSGIWAAFGLAACARWSGFRDRRVPLAAAGALLAAVVAIQWRDVSERGNYLVEDYTGNMLRSFQPDALAISYQWDYWVAAACYYQRVEHLRPDVTVLDKELLRRSWYLTQIRWNHPELYRRSRPEIEAFLAEVAKFEHGTPYAPQIIEQRYNAMINSFIDRNFADRPVYLTPEMEPQFAPAYERVPEGLAFRLYRRGEPAPLTSDFLNRLAFRPFERGNRLTEKLMSLYADMLTNRGIFLNVHQCYPEAERYFQRAIAFVPDHPLAVRWRQTNAAAMAK